MLGLHFCARAFSSCGKRRSLFIAVCGPLTIAASPVVEHRLQTRRLSSCGSQAQLLRGTWDLPRPGLEPVSPSLAGRFSTTAPPGKPEHLFIRFFVICISSLVKCLLRSLAHFLKLGCFLIVQYIHLQRTISWDTGTISVPHQKKHHPGFPGGAVVENLPANAGDTGSSPGLGRSHVPRSN